MSFTVTVDHIKKVCEPYVRGDFTSFIRDACTPDIVFILGSGKHQHEYDGTHKGTQAVDTMINEGLTGHEVEGGKIRAEYVKTLISGNEAFIQWHLIGGSKADGKEFYLANRMHLTFNKDGKITEWIDNLDTLVIAKTGGLSRLNPNLL
ncbi:hypothetical protein D9758_013769 [Tetrapyrgos nigripes]|uniref:SnoaL-like domain-containing protein n=1 Tax=Tetrapyrgos nigripes TaxID=182062 RepID=A0A8H5D500_9AGAR|nr:hypothetical protein D9758_013769 [Tetrapyrgos nigripes]